MKEIIMRRNDTMRQKQGQDLSKQLYRSTTELAKRLDDARTCARTITDLFTPTLQIQRRKFCEYCERLIFTDPTLYGRKGEELLWRKGFYDVITSVKKLKRQPYQLDEILHIESHINSGIGFYHHLAAKLQTEHSLNLQNSLDFYLVASSISQPNANNDAVLTSIHQILLYLGDLNRYKLEIYPKWRPVVAFRYYLQAVALRNEFGMPFNQMGTLATSQDDFISALYYYLRCLACKKPFEGTINNLKGLFERNAKNFEQLTDVNCLKFTYRFLQLVDVWYFNKKIKVYDLCHQTYQDFEASILSLNCCESPLESDDQNVKIDILDNDKLFKVVVVCLICISKLKTASSGHSSTGVAFLLGIYSQLLQNFTKHIKESVSNYPMTEIEAKNDLLITGGKKKRVLDRRRQQFDVSESESSESESESSDSESSSSESDDNNNLSLQEAETDDLTVENGEIDVEVKIGKMDVNDMLEILTEDGALSVIGVVNEWLMQETAILQNCCANTKSLLKQITNLLNYCNFDLKTVKFDETNLSFDDLVETHEKIALTENIMLKGCEGFETMQKKLNFDVKNRSFSAKEETIVRVVKFISFGKFLSTISETAISLDNKTKHFTCKIDEVEPVDVASLTNGDVENEEILINEDETSGQLMKMKHMGQLWLASEVSALENQVKGNGKASLSPYLVIDADALIKYTFMVKNLVQSRKFIVLIPSAVVSALDDLKREQSEARDAIRWLELQFQRGNRFFRSQRPQERAAIPFIKYPKKKDKEMMIYIQIIECCYFLAEQQKEGNLVTLLIGNQNLLSNGENKEFSYVGLAQSAGVAIEAISQFYGKWKKTNKGNKR